MAAHLPFSEVLEAVLTHANIAPQELVTLARVSRSCREAVHQHWSMGPKHAREGIKAPSVIPWPALTRNNNKDDNNKKRGTCQCCDHFTNVKHPIFPDRRMCITCMRSRVQGDLRLLPASHVKRKYFLSDDDLQRLFPVAVVRQNSRAGGRRGPTHYYLMQDAIMAALYKFGGMKGYATEKRARHRVHWYHHRAREARDLIRHLYKEEYPDPRLECIIFDLCASDYARNGKGGISKVRRSAITLRILVNLSTHLTRQLSVFEEVARGYISSEGQILYLDRWLSYQPRAQTLLERLVEEGCTQIPRHSMAMYSYVTGARDDIQSVVDFIRSVYNHQLDLDPLDTASSAEDDEYQHRLDFDTVSLVAPYDTGSSSDDDEEEE